MTIDFKDIPFFRGLSASDLNSVRSCIREKTFSKGNILFQEGKACERIFIVRSGRVKVYRMNSVGKEQILEMLEPGETCACNPGATTWNCSASAEAVTACKVWFLSRADYVRLVNNNLKISHMLNKLFAERLNRFSCLIEEVTLKDVKRRIVKFLLDMKEKESDQSGEGPVISIPFTREEIANRIGTARETVARNLYQLKDKGLLDIKPKRIILKDVQALKDLIA